MHLISKCSKCNISTVSISSADPQCRVDSKFKYTFLLKDTVWLKYSSLLNADQTLSFQQIAYFYYWIWIRHQSPEMGHMRSSHSFLVLAPLDSTLFYAPIGSLK